MVVYINSNRMGKGEDELGAVLMRSFLKNVLAVEPKPEKMIFVNSGVFLTTTDEDCYPIIQEIEKSGIEIVSCGTCLDYYNVKDKLRCGSVTNMNSTVQILMNTDKVVTL